MRMPSASQARPRSSWRARARGTHSAVTSRAIATRSIALIGAAALASGSASASASSWWARRALRSVACRSARTRWRMPARSCSRSDSSATGAAGISARGGCRRATFGPARALRSRPETTKGHLVSPGGPHAVKALGEQGLAGGTSQDVRTFGIEQCAKRIDFLRSAGTDARLAADHRPLGGGGGTGP